MKRVARHFARLAAGAVGRTATTYVRVEKDGTKTYSDRPLPGGQPVDLQPAQTYSAPPPRRGGRLATPPRAAAAAAGDDFRYASCAIFAEHDETFQNPETVIIAVSHRPGSCGPATS